jgi:hypothetical protein
MTTRAATPQGRKLSNINNMPNRRYLPSINFSVPFARWSHFYVSIDWTTGEVNVFGTNLSGNCSRYNICAWATLPPSYTTSISVNSTFVKFSILNDLMRKTRLLMLTLLHCTVCSAATNKITDVRQLNTQPSIRRSLFAIHVYEACKKFAFSLLLLF